MITLKNKGLVPEKQIWQDDCLTSSQNTKIENILATKPSTSIKIQSDIFYESRTETESES